MPTTPGNRLPASPGRFLSLEARYSTGAGALTVGGPAYLSMGQASEADPSRQYHQSCGADRRGA
jgi:hypothetical protein